METLERLALPNDSRKGPNCGVTAIAIVAGVSFETVWRYFRTKRRNPKSGRWKGGTTHSDRVLALEHFGVRCNTYILRDRRRLYAWMRDRAEPDKVYLLRVTGHVLVACNGFVVDQHGPCPIATYWCRNKFLTSVTEVLA